MVTPYTKFIKIEKMVFDIRDRKVMVYIWTICFRKVNIPLKPNNHFFTKMSVMYDFSYYCKITIFNNLIFQLETYNTSNKNPSLMDSQELDRLSEGGSRFEK